MMMKGVSTIRAHGRSWTVVVCRHQTFVNGCVACLWRADGGIER